MPFNSGISAKLSKMIPFPGTDNQSEGSSSSASDKLSALPHQTASPPRTTRASPSTPSPNRTHRRSLDASFLNFPTFATDSDISPLRKLIGDKLGTHTSRGTGPPISLSEGNSPDHGIVTLSSGKRVFGRHPRIGSDPHIPQTSTRSPAQATDGSATTSNRQRRDGFSTPRSPSTSKSRGVSPFRFIQSLSAGLHHDNSKPEPEELFIPINPFKSKISFDFTTWFRKKPSEPDIELAEPSAIPTVINPSHINSTNTSTSSAKNCDDALMISSIKDCFKHSNIFLGDVLPRLIYLHILLRLPAFYFSRVARIFREAEVSRPDIERMIEAGQYCVLPPAFDPTQGQEHFGNTEGQPPQQISTPALRSFKHSWEMFIDSLVREWKTLNVVSALLASAILTIFQIPDAAGDPVTRTAAIVSLICALMSLTYGCMYIVRFGTMRTMVRASKWAEEARRTNTAILWNVWVLLAMPAVWLAWSMLVFMITILAFVWRSDSSDDPSSQPPLSKTQILGPRIAITFIAFIGVVYLALIIRTLKSYGMDGGISQNILTSPQTRLGVLGEIHTHARFTSAEPQVTRLTVPDELTMELALERRGRERRRSESTPQGRRREERSEVRKERWHDQRKPELKAGNELGLFPVSSNSSTGRVV